MENTEQTNPWDRQEAEGIKPYNAFWEYAKMGPKRSLTKLAEQMSKSRSVLKKWSAIWGWKKRAEAYDIHLIKEELKTIEADARKAATESITIANALKKKGLQALVNMDEELMTPNVILSFLTKGVELEQQAREELLKLLRKALQAPEGEAGSTETTGGVVIYLPEKDEEPEEGE